MRLASLLPLFLFFVLVACSRAGADSHPFSIPTPQEIRTLRTELESYRYVGTADRRPEAFNPEKILPRIHPWLAHGFGLRLGSRGPFRAFFLRPIPSDVVASLNEILYDDSTPVPLMILRSSFWIRAAKLQREGFEIGFKVYESGSTEAGVFFEHGNTMLFDTMAEYGTLSHELRHGFQFAALGKTRAPSLRHPDLTDSCVDAFGRFLGELDSTGVELNEWIGVFRTFEYKPERYRTFTDVTQADFHNFHAALLEANLNYPSLASEWVSRSDCPDSVKNANIEISKVSQELLIRIRKATDELSNLRAGYAWSCVHKNTICKNNILPADREICKESEVFASRLDQRADAAMKVIDHLLKTGGEERIRHTRDMLALIPDSYKPVLCKNVRAFALAGNCP